MSEDKIIIPDWLINNFFHGFKILLFPKCQSVLFFKSSDKGVYMNIPFSLLLRIGNTSLIFDNNLIYPTMTYVSSILVMMNNDILDTAAMLLAAISLLLRSITGIHWTFTIPI